MTYRMQMAVMSGVGVFLCMTGFEQWHGLLSGERFAVPNMVAGFYLTGVVTGSFCTVRSK